MRSMMNVGKQLLLFLSFKTSMLRCRSILNDYFIVRGTWIVPTILLAHDIDRVAFR